MDWLYVTMPIAGLDVFWPGLVILGLGVGIIGGFLGMGGGWVVTPALNILGFPMTFAIGTGVAQVAGVSIVGTIRHARLGNVDAKMGAVVALGGVLGIQIGVQAVMWLERINLAGVSIRTIYVALLCLVAWLVYADIRKAKKAKGPVDSRDALGAPWHRYFHRISIPPVIDFPVSRVRCSIWLPAAVGLLTGVLAGLLGIGGGPFTVPMLMYVVGCSPLKAVGTALFGIMFSTLYAAFTYSLYGRTEIFAALLILAGASFGAHLGATATKYVKGIGIKYGFAGAVIGCAISVILKQLADRFTGYSALFNLLSLILVLGLVFALCVYIAGCMVIGMKKQRAGERASGP